MIVALQPHIYQDVFCAGWQTDFLANAFLAKKACTGTLLQKPLMLLNLPYTEKWQEFHGAVWSSCERFDIWPASAS